jgi:hypothetical protein
MAKVLAQGAAKQYRNCPFFLDQFQKKARITSLDPPVKYRAVKRKGDYDLASQCHDSSGINIRCMSEYHSFPNLFIAQRSGPETCGNSASGRKA